MIKFKAGDMARIIDTDYPDDHKIGEVYPVKSASEYGVYIGDLYYYPEELEKVDMEKIDQGVKYTVNGKELTFRLVAVDGGNLILTANDSNDQYRWNIITINQEGYLTKCSCIDTELGLTSTNHNKLKPRKINNGQI